MDFFEEGVGSKPFFFGPTYTWAKSRLSGILFFEAGVGAKRFCLALRTRGQSRDLVDFFEAGVGAKLFFGPTYTWAKSRLSGFFLKQG